MNKQIIPMVVLLLSFLKMEIGALSSNFVYDVYGVVKWCPK